MSHCDQNEHNRYQRAYFDSTERSRIALARSPYVASHVARMITESDLSPDQRIVEIGAGLGKFTLPLVEQGLDVTANDLSPVLLERLARMDGGIDTVCCDVLDLDHHVTHCFDRAIGFFVLHHLMNFPAVFAALARVLVPGGRIAFCEPVARNPLYYLQVAFTPGMRFAGEPSLTSMRKNVLFPAMRSAGFTDCRVIEYGYFPPVLKNSRWGDRFETWMEDLSFLPFPHAFQCILGTLG